MTTGHRTSFWEETSLLAPADVVIIGSGIVGMNAAITLRTRRPDLSVLVVERGAAPIGASTRNAGFACYGSLTEVVSDIHSIGYESALELVRLRKRGLERLIEVAGEKALDLKHYGGYEVFLEEDMQSYEAGMEWLEKINADLKGDFGGDFLVPIDTGSMPVHMDCKKCVSHPFEGQLHPGKMVQRLQDICRASGVRFLYGAEVDTIDEHSTGVKVKTGVGEIMAGHVVLATNGFATRFVDGLDLEPARNQVLLSEPLEDFQLRGCYHNKQGYVYFRNVGNRLLIGAARHIDMEKESTAEFGLTESITSWLTNFAKEHVVGREVKFSHAWSGILGVGPSKQPIIENVSPNITVAVRLGGMGVAIGSLVGEQAAETVLNSL